MWIDIYTSSEGGKVSRDYSGDQRLQGWVENLCPCTAVYMILLLRQRVNNTVKR